MLKSLGRRTDLIFARFSGHVEYREDYVVVKTPRNPGYHWGNYLIFHKPPVSGDFEVWTEIFDKEFPDYGENHHYLFTWDSELPGDVEPFIRAGYHFDEAKVLVASSLKPPRHYNDQVVIQKIPTERPWEDVLELQVSCADPKFLEDGYRNFKRRQLNEYKRMSQSGRGHWFGAFYNGRLVADLGVFFEDNLARYQNVGTHPEFRRRGICATLVYEAGKMALREFGVKKLVMEADANYHAARIYESVGFQACETNYSVSRW